jgi:hypothetical protein
VSMSQNLFSSTQNKLERFYLASFLRPGACIIKLIMAVIHGARVFVPIKPFQPTLVFVGEARAYPSE